jgi:hypothetical protein
MAWVAMMRSTKANWRFTDMLVRTDADGNSIPCETVYSTVADNKVWSE